MPISIMAMNGGMKMKFVKGMILGTCISAGAFMLYTENSKKAKKMMKQGKKMIKNMGIM